METSDGDLLPYETLVIATGARARTLACVPTDNPRVFTLRSIADARALRKLIRPGFRLAVIGAGLVGLEAAAVVVQQQCSVTVFEMGDRVMARCVPAIIGERVAGWHRSAGVDLKLSCAVTGVNADGTTVRITTTEGEFEFDALLVAIGAIPNTELASEAGLDVQDGILVDEFGRTSVGSVYAAGEVAQIRQPMGGYRRFETWQVAQHQPIAVAHSICGLVKPYGELPWHWSDQYGHNIQVLGQYTDDLRWIERESSEGRVTVLGLCRDSRIKAAVLINNGREITPLRRLIHGGRPFAGERLLDRNVPLKFLSSA